MNFMPYAAWHKADPCPRNRVRYTDPSLGQQIAYYGELVGSHGLDAAQWGVAGGVTYYALSPDDTTPTTTGK